MTANPHAPRISTRTDLILTIGRISALAQIRTVRNTPARMYGTGA